MNEQLKPVYEGFKAEFSGVAAMQGTINQSVPVNGQRVWIPLDGREIEVVIYRQEDVNAPVLFCSYGGGFVMGGCAIDNLMWKTVAERFGCTLISIGYRRAPEFHFPCAVFDVYDTVCYFAEHAAEYQLNKEKFMVFGASAGANLSTAASILDNLNGTHYIKKQILNYPYLDLATDPADKGHHMGEILMYYFFPEAYPATPDDLKNPLLSPVYATSKELQGLPETIMVCGENDALRQEGERYLKMLSENGVKTYYMVADGMEHGFIEFNFSLQYTPLEQSFCSDATKENFKNGKLAQETERALAFIESILDSNC